MQVAWTIVELSYAAYRDECFFIGWGGAVYSIYLRDTYFTVAVSLVAPVRQKLCVS
jgi:hypothetical protein